MSSSSTPSYIGPVYEPAQNVIDLHATPRFGYDSDFSKIASQNSDEQLAYFYGAIFVSVFVFIFFIGWSFILLLFKCLGRSQVGYLSGSKFLQPVRGPYNRPGRVRVTVILANIAIIAFCVLLVTEGANEIYAATGTVQDGTNEFYDIAKGTEAGGAEMLEENQVVNTGKDALLSLGFDTYCDGVDTLDAAGVLANLDAVSAYEGELVMLENQAGVAAGSIGEFYDFLDDYVMWEWWQAIPILAFMVCASLFVVGTSLAWAGVGCGFYQCMQTWIVLPIFSILTIASWILAGAFGITMVMNSDFCSGGASPGSPDNTIVSIMDEQGMDPYSLVYESAEYVAMGCRTENPFQFVTNYHEQVTVTASATQEYLNSMNDLGASYLSQNCPNPANITSIQSTLQTLNNDLMTLAETSFTTMSLLNCKDMNEIYVDASHDATCAYSIDALIWIFASLLVLSTCGMAVITMRSAWLDVEREDMNSANLNQVTRPKGKKGSVEMTDMKNTKTSTSSHSDERNNGLLPMNSTETWERIPPNVLVSDVPPLLDGQAAGVEVE